MLKKIIILMVVIAINAIYAENKKILWVDSYNNDYEWSIKIEEGIDSILNSTNIEVKKFRMDTKKKKSEELKIEMGNKVLEVFKEFKPDLVIASDDNAQKYFVVPYLKNTDTPVVFCGVNWDATPYGYPTKNITGMIEVEFVESLKQQLIKYAKGKKCGVLSDNTLTGDKLYKAYNEKFFNQKLTKYDSKNFEEYKKNFIKANEENDFLFHYNVAGIKDWDNKKGKAFILKNIKKPIGCVREPLAHFSMLSFAKSPYEQGQYSAQTALKILNGTKPADIPIVKNKKVNILINMKIAKKLNIFFDLDLLKKAKLVK